MPFGSVTEPVRSSPRMENTSLPLTTRWFRRERLQNGVSLIWEHHVSPDVHCNIWMVEGRDALLLFDSGMGLRSLKAEIQELAERPVICVSSHSHFDHMGGAWEFGDHRAHGAEADVFAGPTPANTLALDYVAEHHFSALPFDGFTASTYLLQAAPVTGCLDDGDVIDLGDRAFQVLHVPGHSPGSIALWEKKTGLLFSGDCLYDGCLLDDLYHSNRDDFIASMERIMRLPVETVHAGHFDSFGRARMHSLAAEYIAGRRKPGCPTG